MNKVIATVLFAIVSVFILLLNGFTLMMLWEWFVVPTFNAPMLSMTVAIGLCLLVNFMTKQNTGRYDNKSVDDTVKCTTIEALFKPVFALALGYALQF